MAKSFDTILDGVETETLNISVKKRPNIPSAERETELIQIEGRDGALTVKKGFKDVSFQIEYNILENYNIKRLLRNIRAFFDEKKILQFSDDTEVYRKIKSMKINETNNDMEEYGLFTVDFVCDPFEYEITNNVIVENQKPFYGSGTYYSEPLLKIYGSGTIDITINSETFRIKDLTDCIYVDSELLEAYNGTVSMNDKMIGKFPLLIPDKNEISWIGNVSKIEIVPRWRYK